ncbi:MAG TPA: helix-turn-helix domain-containing protein [Amycolatopsis sp.]|nr:helix-turn-helix domain-containing protein [Amycolatopsis sp.]
MQHASRMSARDRILDAASQLFYAEGIRAVGVDRVIDEAKVAKATLYAHFRSKDTLIEAYLRREADRMKADLQRLEAHNEPGLARVAALFDHGAAVAAEPGYQGCCFINAAAEHVGSAGEVAEIIAASRAMQLDYFARNVDRRSRAERSRAARVVLALFDGAKVASVSEGGAAFKAVRQAALALAAAPAEATG